MGLCRTITAMKTLMTLVRMVFGVALFSTITLPFAASPLVPPDGVGPLPEADCMPKYPPPPTVKIMVRVPACTDPGTAIKYVICIENCSPAEAHHVVVKNALPENAKFVKADPAPAKQGPELQWNLGTVGGGARREIILFLQPTNKEDVKNCARVQFEHGQCVTTRQAGSIPLPPGVRPPVISTVPDVPAPEGAPVLDLVIRGPKEQYGNLPSRYEISVTNKGKSRATALQINARVSEKLKVMKASDPGVAVENVVAWNLGNLEPGATRSVDLTLRAIEKGEHCFKVEAIADPGLKKEVEHCTKFTGTSAMTIEMIDKVDPVFVGYKTSYPVVIRNQGTEPLTTVRLKAFVPESLKFERANAHAEPKAPIKGGQWIEFPSLPPIPVGQEAKYEIFVEAMQPGVTVFHIEVTADQLELGRPVIEQESTTVVDDRMK